MNARIGLVVMTAVVVQAALASQMRLLGVTPAIMILMAIAGGALAGPDQGAIIGFASGVGMDVLVQTPFGLWALTGTLVGWGVGHLHGRLVAPGRLSRAVSAALGTAAGVGIFVTLGSLLGQEHLFGLPVGRLMLGLVIANVVLMPLAAAAMCWALDIDLPGARRSEPGRRRRLRLPIPRRRPAFALPGRRP
jgi:rod shape-determining protein MreD